MKKTLQEMCSAHCLGFHLLRRFSTTTTPLSSSPVISGYGSNNSINPFIYNRNPRNLERLRIAFKPDGFALDNKPSNFWNR